MYKLASIRFNSETYSESARYREARGIGCIYGSPVPTSEKYSRECRFFVLEMNNTTNQIMGIGLIQNTNKKDRTYIVYDMIQNQYNFNRFIYRGDYWLGRDQLPDEVVALFDKILFKGKSHLKRSVGLTVISDKLFVRWQYEQAAILQQIKQLFMTAFELTL
jgi:hypothetical protein